MDDQSQAPLKARTIVAQALGAGDTATKALVPPIHMSATYLRDPDNGYSSGYVYGRTDNVSVQQVEALVAALEGAEEAMTFASGMAAASAVFLALEKPTHVVASQVMYWGFRSWLRNIGRYGHSITFVETSDLQAVREAVRPGETGLFWIETPSNPLWTITDIAAISEIAHDANALLCVDSTVATPIFTRPIAHGADVVVHSATKYLNGHSDVVAGAIATARVGDFWERIREVRTHIGALLGPFDAWLLMRGMRTLEVRVREQARTAALLANRLADHPGLSLVLYPGLSTHPGHEVAARQMVGGFGGMLSIRACQSVEAGDFARRCREPHRTSGLDRGSWHALPCRSLAAIGRSGRSGRSLFRSRARLGTFEWDALGSGPGISAEDVIFFAVV